MYDTKPIYNLLQLVSESVDIGRIDSDASRVRYFEQRSCNKLF